MVEWEEFDRLEPLGGYKDDFRFAQLCNLIYVLAHAIGGTKVESKVQDFMPWWFMQYIKDANLPKRQSVDEMKANLMAWAKRHNRMVARQSRREGQK